MDRDSHMVKFSMFMSVLDHSFYKFCPYCYWVRTLGVHLAHWHALPLVKTVPVFKGGFTFVHILNLGSRWS
jgi:hypothetical protein